MMAGAEQRLQFLADARSLFAFAVKGEVECLLPALIADGGDFAPGLSWSVPVGRRGLFSGPPDPLGPRRPSRGFVEGQRRALSLIHI